MVLQATIVALIKSAKANEVAVHILKCAQNLKTLIIDMEKETLDLRHSTWTNSILCTVR